MPEKITLIDQDEHFFVKEGETILTAALRQGHNLPYGCRNGSCGFCKAKVIEGKFEYGDIKPEGLTKTELKQGCALLCSARPKTDMTIKARTIESVEDIKLRQLPCRVTVCEKLNKDVIRIILELPKTERLQFLAGQYINIVMREGKRRAFSLANPPHNDQSLELHVRHYNGGLFSEYAFKDLKEKTVLRIEGPLGQFTLHDAERPIIMIAGGTGFAPIKSLVEHTLEIGDRRSIAIYWGARGETDLYMSEMVEKWVQDNSNISYTPVLSDVEHLNDWTGKTGFVHEAVMEDYADLSDFDIYACGPPPMVQAVVEKLPAHDLDRTRLFSDSFEFAAS